MTDINFVPGDGKKKKTKSSNRAGDEEISVAFHTPPKPAKPKSELKKRLVSGFSSFVKSFREYIKKAGTPVRENPAPKPRRFVEKKREKPTAKPERKQVSSPNPVNLAQENSPAKFTQPNREDRDDHILGVNLMPWHDPRALWQRRVRTIIIGTSILIVVLWGVQLRIGLSDKRENIAMLQSEIQDLDSRISEFDESELIVADRTILAQREFMATYKNIPRWTKFVSWLEKVTHPDVSYTDMAISGSGTVLLTAVSPEYKSAAEQWFVFEEETNMLNGVKVGELEKVSLDRGGDKNEIEEKAVSFSIELSVNMSALNDSE